MAVAERHNLPIVEDAAQGVDAQYNGRYLGTIGDLGTYSFHETKNAICGEGGSLVVNNPAFEDRAEFIREKGTNRSNFTRGKVDKYTWIDIGSSYALADVLAAFLWGQLQSLDTIRAMRATAFARYVGALSPLQDLGLLRLPAIPAGCETNYHMFYVLLDRRYDRAEVSCSATPRHPGGLHFVLPICRRWGARLGLHRRRCPSPRI
jgi:dTDP-4-amino-4,6-dideoxygalactose transaminase